MAGKVKVEPLKEAQIRGDLEKLVKDYGFESVRRIWNGYSKTLKERDKLLAERKAVEDRLAELDRKLK